MSIPSGGQKEDIEVIFWVCRKYNLHLGNLTARIEIVKKLANIANKIRGNTINEIPENFDDLRVINNEYIASYIGTPFNKLHLGHINFNRESGVSELDYTFPNSAKKIDDMLNSKNLRFYKDVSIQSDGSLKQTDIRYSSSNPVCEVKTKVNKSLLETDGVCPYYSDASPLSQEEMVVQLSTGTPKQPYFLSWHNQYHLDENGQTITSSKKGVTCVHESRQAFLDGDEPLIIMFHNIGDRDTSDRVYRRLPDGSYIDYSSAKVDVNGKTIHNTYSLQELIDKSETFLHPHCDIVMNGVRGEVDKVIPHEYIDLYKELLGKIRPDGQGNSEPAISVPEDDVPEI